MSNDVYLIPPDTTILDIPQDGDVLPDWYTPYVEGVSDAPGGSLDASWELDGIDTYALSPITPADATGLKKVLLEVLGSYDNIATQYRYLVDGASRYTYVVEITPDYPWIASAVLFIAMVVSLFQIVRRSLWNR